jgi:hypothetical protein
MGQQMSLGIDELVRFARSSSDWDLGNRVLYSLCRRYPAHDRKQAVIAKVWLVGRAYAAALERRRKFRKMRNDEFYRKKIAPIIMDSAIDVWIASATRTPRLDPESLPTILEVHAKVTNLFSTLSGLDKRSLASKYLRFHLPRRFFIYDTRAVKAIGYFKAEMGRVKVTKNKHYDHEYEGFSKKCLSLQAHIKAISNVDLTPRQLDNLLLKIHADNPRPVNR